MVGLQNTKVVGCVSPGVIKDDAAFTVLDIDTVGWDYLWIIVSLGTIDATMAALEVEESDDDSTYADVTGLVYGTSTNTAGSTSALPVDADDADFFGFEIDLRGRKRYMRLVATAGNGAAGTYLTAIGILSRGDEAKQSAANRGFNQILRV